MFKDVSNFNQDIGNWDVSNVLHMKAMFYGASSFNQDIGDWDVSHVMDMSYIFFKATSFDSDLSQWKIENVMDFSMAFDSSGLSQENYDALLINWSQQNVKSNVSLGAKGIHYDQGENGRKKLLDDFNWKINDAGKD
jgi:surface protein